MKRALAMSLVPAAVLAAGIGGYEAGRRDLALPGWARLVSEMEPANASPEAGGAAKTGRVIYYRDPDGRPFYSAAPRKTADGREFLAVYAGEDVSLDTGAPVKEAASATPGADKGRVLYYRNPMGLPDTSPTPKKDSMGMDYIPVYESEGAGGSSIKVAVGRLQQTGVRTATAVDKAIVASVRVPGTIQLDERRVTVVSTRADAFVNKVAEVTTGDRVTKGQALLQLYAPEIAAAGAQFLNDLGAATHNSTLGGARQRLENLGVPPDAMMVPETAPNTSAPIKARTRFVAGPAAATATIPKRGSRSRSPRTGTGFAQPNIGPPNRASAPGTSRVPIGSTWRIGLSERRRCSLAVGSPRASAVQPWATS